MRVLVGCEKSGVVREAFRKAGHDAWSNDLEAADDCSPFHIQGDILEVGRRGWDMLIAHPPCRYLALSGIRWFYHPGDKHLPVSMRRPHPDYPDRYENFLEAVRFYNAVWSLPIEKKCLENSQWHGLAQAILGKPHQILQPYHVGSNKSKAACLKLKGLPPIRHTSSKSDFSFIHQEAWEMPPGPDRESKRSKTNEAIANAFVGNWG